MTAAGPPSLERVENCTLVRLPQNANRLQPVHPFSRSVRWLHTEQHLHCLAARQPRLSWTTSSGLASLFAPRNALFSPHSRPALPVNAGSSPHTFNLHRSSAHFSQPSESEQHKQPYPVQCLSHTPFLFSLSFHQVVSSNRIVSLLCSRSAANHPNNQHYPSWHLERLSARSRAPSRRLD